MGTKESKHSNSVSYEDSVKRGESPPAGYLWGRLPAAENRSLPIKKTEPPAKATTTYKQVQSIPLCCCAHVF